MQVLEDFRTGNVERIKSTRLVQAIMKGTPEQQHYVGYLVNVYNYAQHSPTVIALAASRCVQTYPELGRYLFRHAEEEIGHELWALSDLKHLGLSEPAVKSIRPTPACMSMIALEYYVAGTWNPVALFGWLYALESLGDAMGTILSESLGQRLLLGGKAVYFLEGHGEADHHHTRDLELHIRQHMTNSKDFNDILYVADISSRLYARLVEEAIDGSQEWDSILV